MVTFGDVVAGFGGPGTSTIPLRGCLVLDGPAAGHPQLHAGVG